MKLAVYGTLKSSHGRWSMLGIQGKVRKIGTIDIDGTLYMLGWYPGLVVGSHPGHKEGNKVTCELLEVTRGDEEAVTSILDTYEGYPTLFGKQSVIDENHGEVHFYTWGHAVSPDNKIESF